MNNLYGNHLGIVISHPQEDPENRGRCQIFIPHITNTIYNLWNETGDDKAIKTMADMSPNLIRKLKTVLPWAECAAPIFGGATTNQYNTTTNQTSSDPVETMVPVDGNGDGGGDDYSSVNDETPDRLPPVNDDNPLDDYLPDVTPPPPENSSTAPEKTSTTSRLFIPPANEYDEKSFQNADGFSENSGSLLFSEEVRAIEEAGVPVLNRPSILNNKGEPPLPPFDNPDALMP